jgi:hypothetical protein
MLNPDLLYIREDCRVLQIDTARANLRTTDDGHYVVTFSKPLVELGSALPDPPEEALCKNAQQAEYELLTGCRRIQLAERNKVRAGRVYGWSGSDINRRPITVEELAEYRASVEHAATVKRLTAELAAVVEQNATAAKANANGADLAGRYNVTSNEPAKKPEAVPVQGTANLRRAPSRGAKA